MLRRGSVCLVSLALLTLTRDALADDGPQIDLAPQNKDASKPPLVSLGSGKASDDEYLHGMAGVRFHHAEESDSNTAIGGYGEVTLAGLKDGPDTFGSDRREWTADLERVVVFVAHNFNDRFRFYGELEWEHAAVCAVSCNGEVEMEQAYLDAKIFGDKLALRGGNLIVPMGIVNQWHEPPVFHGVFRPDVETFIIPSTWNELGVGAFGAPVEGVRFELYAVTAIDPLTISSRGMAGVPQKGSLARANAPAVAGRLEIEPMLGVVLGASGYASDAGPNGTEYDATGQEEHLSEPVLGVELDARIRRRGLEAKALFVELHIPNAGDLMNAFDKAKGALVSKATPIPEVMRGGYVELAYDVLHPFAVSHQLLPFARLEAYDTQTKVPDGFVADESGNVRELTAGLSYRPLQQIVVKTDLQEKVPRRGPSSSQLDFGFGFMY